MQQGRACDVSAACHWAVNAAAAQQAGTMWGHAYSLSPAASSSPLGPATRARTTSPASRKLTDTTFMMGALVPTDVDEQDVHRCFRALRRAQRDIDLDQESVKQFWLRELPEDLAGLVDVRRFGPGERIAFEPYTREMFERTRAWMRERDLLDAGGAVYEQAVRV